MRQAVPTNQSPPAPDNDEARSTTLEDLDRVRFFLRPWILLLLKEQSSHGYELIKRLKSVGFDGVDRSVYRTLSALERSDAIEASWDTPAAGPARRVFAITPTGEDDLRRWADMIEHLSSLLDAMVGRYRTATAAAAAPAEAAAPAAAPRKRRRWRS